MVILQISLICNQSYEDFLSHTTDILVFFFFKLSNLLNQFSIYFDHDYAIKEFMYHTISENQKTRTRPRKKRKFFLFFFEFLFSCFLDRFFGRVLVFLFSYFLVFFYPHGSTESLFNFKPNMQKQVLIFSILRMMYVQYLYKFLQNACFYL